MNKIIAIILIVALPLTANAAMQDMLNNMFMSNVTNPQAYQTQNRAGYVGGSVELRAPIKPITLAAFDPPRFNAGCGGLDMYGGSFSFINASQFTTLIRAIMANAVGLMFQAALKSINPMIADLVNYFQDVVNGLNKAAGNTCAIAHQIPGLSDPNSKTESAENNWTDVMTKIGNTPDHFTSKWPGSKAATKANAVSAESGSTASDPNAEKIGNSVWRGLQRTAAYDKLNFFPVTATTTVNGVAVSDNDFKAEILMSMIGTEVNSTSKASGTEVLTPVEYTPVLKISDLVNELRSTDTMSFYSCQPATAGSDLAKAAGPGALQFGSLGCPEVIPMPLPFSGTMPYVKSMLYGDPSATSIAQVLANPYPYSADSPHPNSIFAKLSSGQMSGLTAPQIAFIRFMPGAMSTIIIEAQSDPASYASFMPFLEVYASYAMAVNIGEAAAQAARASFSGVPVPIPASISANIHTMDSELMALKAMVTHLKDGVGKAYAEAQAVRRALQSPK